MPRCTHKGCGKEYDEADNTEGSCSYHPGAPVFHEGLKSWSCCKEVNKPVMEFDQFMAIPTCAQGKHTTEAPVMPKPAAVTTDAPASVSASGVETYGAKTPAKPATPAPQAALHADTPEPEVKEDEQDDLSLPVPAGAKCKRLGCGAEWEGEAVSRGDGEKAVCRYHPQAPVFHEGSKGYLCCKPRVLEFAQFLAIPGCKEGKHLFVGQKKGAEEEIVPVRIDHYQTPLEVHVSVFAKQADKEKSKVTFTPQTIELDLHLPNNKRVLRTVTLYGAIVPEKSTYRILGTKVDILLIKPAVASWPLLELPPPGTELPPGYALTFGVSGRTGTVGGKEVVLSVEEAARQAAGK
ncbi:hypothetical protein VHUM_01290 [Vanrija humicola]|uniref:CHORD domain-containing protein n=1 Tax=Vanrija humicola TaxID=5417 RepID=A0A7D8Z1Q1_VANHU|nr:hypothetical protein VHUM_01290 [Vanrija humicola]